MKTYAATFVAGTEQVIERQLKQLPIQSLKITYTDESLVVFESIFPPDRIIDFAFFNNTFLVFAETTARPTDSDNDMIERLYINNSSDMRLEESNIKFIINDSGEPRSTEKIEPEAIWKLKNSFTMSEQGLNELWLIQRRDNKIWLAQRLNRPLFKRSKRPAGALRPELAHILGLIAGVKSRDVVLDLFSGHGSVSKEIARGFAPKKVIAADIDSKKMEKLEKTKQRGLLVIRSDVKNLPLEPNSIDKILADPPWGRYQKNDNLTDIYEAMITVIAKVLKQGGVAVILSPEDEMMQAIFAKSSELSLIKSYSILVSGQKANIYKLLRN
ncbi:MAG TPA: methyltransferase domain-containing protein [Candidatus Babeliales bacterium]|nr:methyltransferase domain-containing protein [Candidatus Babeliales bacterium]